MQNPFPAPLSMNGTLGRVYGGDPGLVHLADGTRGSFGQRVASFIDAEMRAQSAAGPDAALCPGCYMVAIVATAMTLADRYGQPMNELGRSLAYAFTQVAELSDAAMELPEEILIAPFVEAQNKDAR